MKKYTIAAAIADIYILAFFAGIFPATYVAIVQAPLAPRVLVFELIGIITVVIVYYASLRHRVSFMMPGELLFGAKITEGKKYWTNPYSMRRIYLFIIIAMVLMGAGNMWDHLSDANVISSLTLPVVAGRAVVVGLSLIGCVFVGRGRVKWLIPVAIFFLLRAFSFSMIKSSVVVLPTIMSIVVASNLLFFVCTVVLYIVYSKNLKKQST